MLHLVQLEPVGTVQVRTAVATYRNLVIFWVAGVSAACARLARGISSVTAHLRADAEGIPQDVLEERFERRHGGGDQTCVELRADPEGYECSVVCKAIDEL